MLNFVLDDDNMFVYMNELIIELLLLNLYVNSMYVNILCSWVKLMSYELLWLNCVRISWLIIVVDVW